MKKIILLLLLIISSNVYAKNIYTDYEFLGYVDEKRENDEFYKYEEVLMNNFYKLVLANEEYLEKSENNKQQYIDENDYKEEWNLSKDRISGKENIGAITLKGEDNYITVSFMISNISKKAALSIKNLEIYNLNKKILFDADLVKDDNGKDAIKVTLNNYTYVDNLRFVIEYDNDNPIEFDLTIINESGLTRIIRHIKLDNTVEKVTLNTLRYDKYTNFLSEHDLVGNDMITYYYHNKKMYRHYDLIKDYYIMSELTELEGYIYDENESILKYKVFKREKTDIDDDSDNEKEENKSDEENLDNVVDNSTIGNTSQIIKEIVKYEQVSNVNYKNKNDETKLDVFEDNKIDRLDDSINKIDKKIDLIQNNTIKNECDCKSEDSKFKKIMITIVIICICVCILILHYITVKFDKLDV